MLTNYLSHFPEGFEPSTQQVNILKSIEQAFKDGNKFVICCAPTGSGKSFISKTLGNSTNSCTPEFKRLIDSYAAYQNNLGMYTYEDECLEQPSFGAFALTITKALQDQYVSLFPDSSYLKGKSNYQCEVDPNFDVETAPCVLTPTIRDKCWNDNVCPYYNARNKSLTDKFSILNYKMFMALPFHVKRKEIIICDEASELEDELVKHYTLFVDPDKLKQLGLIVPYLYKEEPQNIISWLNQLSEIIHGHISDLSIALNEKKRSSVTDRRKLSYFTNLHGTVKQIIDTWQGNEYVCQRDGKTVKLSPLRVNNLANSIFKCADKVLLMSATIIDHANFAKNLGIEKYSFVEVDSTFDPKKAPIYISTKIKLNRANLEKNLPILAQQVQKICDQHKGEKGIIHTHTMQITSYLQKNLKGNRFIYRDAETANEEMLKQHTASTNPSVLVSPSMTFGVDLKGDLARFQIIVKAAYLPLNDVRIKKLFDQDKIWYLDKMLCNLVQACGRGNRSKDDYCVTYILDGVLFDAIVSNKGKLPKYFIDRFV